MTLQLLGMASLAFVVIFTMRAYRDNSGVGQTPRWAIVEAWVNIVIGFSLNMVMNTVMIPLMTGGAHVTLADNWWGGWVYTAASLVRSYAIRRAANAFHMAAQ